jgi:UDP-glucuronate decarboxylase
MTTGPAVTGPMNLGNPKEFTIRELAELIREVIGTNVPFIHQPLPMDDPQRRQPDIAYARETLNWEPRVALRQGIETTVAYFDRLLSATTGRPPELRQVV